MLVGSARTSTLELQSGPWNKPGQLNHAPPLLRGSVFGSRRLYRPAPPCAGVFVLRRGLMMFMISPAPMRRVLAPDGTVLTLANLPSPDAQRWVASRKAIVVAAVRGGLLSMSAVCARYRLTTEEFLSWQTQVDRDGLHGLRTTRIQEYRGRGRRMHGHDARGAGPR